MKNKLLSMLLAVLLLAAVPVAVFADGTTTAEATQATEVRTEHVIDRADVFALLDMQMADMKLSYILETYGVDVVIFAVEEVESAKAEALAKAVYDDEDGNGEHARGYGKNRDGAIIMIETKSNKFTLYGVGKGETFANDSMRSYYNDRVRDYLGSGNYSSAILEIVSIVDHFAVLSLSPLPTTDPTKDTPPTGDPTKDTPPTGDPTKDTPPTGDPTKDPPPTGDPTKDTPPTGDPTKDTPPTGDPTKDTPPTGDPTKDTPKTDDPTTPTPTPDTPGTGDTTPDKPKKDLPWRTKFAIAVVISVIAALLLAGITFGSMVLYNMNTTRSTKAKHSKKKAKNADKSGKNE